MRVFTSLTLVASAVASVVQLNARTEPRASSLGCFASTSDSSPLASGILPSSLTTGDCMAACAGFPYFSVQGGTDCRCSRSPPAGAAAAPNMCTLPCTGNKFEICGGTAHANFYALDPHPTATTYAKRSNAGSSLDKREVAPRASAAAITSVGCFYNAAVASYFSVKSTLSLQDLRVEDCMAYCAGSTYFGVSQGTTCTCYIAGAHSVPLAAPLKATMCALPCTGNQFELCGGSGGPFVYAYPKGSSCTAATTTSSAISSVKVATTSSSTSTPKAAATTSTSAAPTCSLQPTAPCFYIIGHGEPHIEGLKLGWEQGEGAPQFNYPATPFWIDSAGHLHTANAYNGVTMTYYISPESWWGISPANSPQLYGSDYQPSTCTASADGTFSCYQYGGINSNLINVWAPADGSDSRAYYIPHWGPAGDMVTITLTWQATTCPNLC